MIKNKVYLTGPITGLSYDGASDWRESFTDKIKTMTENRIKCASPMRGKHYLKSVQDIQSTGNEKLGIMSGGPAILMRDFHDVKSSDVIVINLLGSKKISIGSMFEVAWAHALQTPIVLVIEDGFENIHTHSMLFSMCGFRVNNLDDAIDIVVNILDI